MMVPKSFVKKIVLVPSKGDFPGEGSNCKFFILDCPSSEFIPQSFWIKKEGIHSITIGEADCDFDYGLEYGLTCMNRHEKSVIELQFNEHICEITIELLDFSQSVLFFRLDVSKKLEIALRHKQLGVNLFQISLVREAFLRFRKSIRYIVALRDGSKASEDLQSLYVDVCNNMALCQLQVGNYEHALILCEKVLGASPLNVKALFRRAKALIQLRLFDRAVDDLRMVISIDSSNKIAIKKLEYVKNALAEQERSYVDMVKRMCPFR